MARVVFNHLVDNAQGKFHKEDDVVYRTRNGKTFGYRIKHPYEGELAESRKAAIGLFAEAVRQCKAEMQDAERLAYWQDEYRRYQRRAKRHVTMKKYSTLRGYMIAKISERLKQEQEDATN